MAKVTIHEIAAKSGDSYGEVNALMNMLVRRGLATKCGNRPNPPGVRGKPSAEYELEGSFEFVLFDDESDNETAPETTPEIAQDEPLVPALEIPSNAELVPA